MGRFLEKVGWGGQLGGIQNQPGAFEEKCLVTLVVDGDAYLHEKNFRKMNYVRRLSNNFLEFIGAKKTPERLQNDGNTKRVDSGAETERPHDELFVTSTPRTPMKKRPKIDGSIQNETNSTTLEKSNIIMSMGKCDFDKDEKQLKSKDKALANFFEQDQRNYDDSDPKWQNDKEISLKEDLEAKEMMDDIIDSFETPKQATSFKNTFLKKNLSIENPVKIQTNFENLQPTALTSSHEQRPTYAQETEPMYDKSFEGQDLDIDQRMVEEPYKNSNSTPNHSLNEEDQNPSTSEKRMQESSFSEPSEESTLDFSIDESFSDDMQDLSRHSSDSSIEENMWSLYSSSSDSASEGYFCKLCNYRTESLFVFERHQKHLDHMNREKRLKTLQSSYV